MNTTSARNHTFYNLMSRQRCRFDANFIRGIHIGVYSESSKNKQIHILRVSFPSDFISALIKSQASMAFFPFYRQFQFQFFNIKYYNRDHKMRNYFSGIDASWFCPSFLCETDISGRLLF